MEFVVNLLPHSAPAPLGEVMINRAPLRQVVRNKPPSTAGAQQIKDSVEHLAHVGLAGSAIFVRRRDQGGKNRPLIVGQVRGIRGSDHRGNLQGEQQERDQRTAPTCGLSKY